jgi:hypothetical protein
MLKQIASRRHKLSNSNTDNDDGLSKIPHI